MKTFGKTDGGDPNSVWEKMRTETLTQGVLSFGIAGQDAGKLQAGGGNVDFSLSNLSQVYEGMKAYSFHSENVSSNEGKARITYVNTGVLSGNATAEKIAMDIFNGDKTLAFGLEAGHLGNAGWDGKTITLNSDAASFGENGLLSNNTLGIFTSVMAKEGSIIDHNLLHGNTQAGEEAKLKSGDAKQVLEVLADRFEREKVSYQVTEEVMNDLARNLGIDVTDQKFKEQVGLAAQGRFGEAGVDWTTGQDFIEPDAVWNYITNIFQTPIDPADLPKIMGDALSGKGNTPLAQFWRDGVIQTAEMALYIARFQILRDGAYDLAGLDEDQRAIVDLCLDAAMIARGIYKFVKAGSGVANKARGKVLGAEELGYKYHPRIRERALQDPVHHNFPYSYDKQILQRTPEILSDGSKSYKWYGSINERKGMYEIVINKKGVIYHRNFRPFKKR